MLKSYLQAYNLFSGSSLYLPVAEHSQNTSMKISVCIPTYNQSQYLPQAIHSVFNQTMMPSEIIVSDDCSTDNTAEVLQELSQEIPILKVIRKNTNLGISQNTDECLRAATGEFIVRLDSDDLLEPTYIEKLSASLSKFPEAGYAHAAVQEIDQHGDFLRQRRLARQAGFQTGDTALLAAKKGYRVAANIIMFRRSALESVNYITGRPNSAEDYHLSAALAAAGFGNVYINEILAFYRIWTDAGKARQRRKLLEINGIRSVFVEVLEPAYKQRNWGLTQLRKRRVALASGLSDCLGWNVYTLQEKQELAEAIKQLSSAKRVKIFRWIHLNGFGNILNMYGKLMERLRLKAKEIIMARRG